MKITITGSLGHISKPLTKELVEKGHSVAVISSDPGKQKEIEALGARAAIGRLQDADFLTTAFTGADAVYCMFPPGNFFDHHFDLISFIGKIAQNYKEAIHRAGVKRVVHLSSIGAHTDINNGLLLYHYRAEHTLRELSPEVALTHLRPVGFYYNLYGFLNAIKTRGVMASNYGGDDKIPWVSPIDIAAVAAEELSTPNAERKIRYIASDEPTCNEVARALGAAIGKPDLKWVVISNEQLQSNLTAFGMSPAIVEGLVEMNAAMHSGELFEDYYCNRPVLGSVKIADFAGEFAETYAGN